MNKRNKPVPCPCGGIRRASAVCCQDCWRHVPGKYKQQIRSHIPGARVAAAKAIREIAVSRGAQPEMF